MIKIADRKALFDQKLGETGHADSADSDKMYMNGFIKMNLIHNYHPVPHRILWHDFCE